MTLEKKVLVEGLQEEYIELMVTRARSLGRELKELDKEYMALFETLEAKRKEKDHAAHILHAVEELLRMEGAFDRLYPVQQ